jgi:molecular chaperone HtpG
MKEMIHLSWDIALLLSGFSLKNSAALPSRINRMVEVALDVAAQLEELTLIIPHIVTSTEGGESIDNSELQKFDELDRK